MLLQVDSDRGPLSAEPEYTAYPLHKMVPVMSSPDGLLPSVHESMQRGWFCCLEGHVPIPVGLSKSVSRHRNLPVDLIAKSTACPNIKVHMCSRQN